MQVACPSQFVTSTTGTVSCRLRVGKPEALDIPQMRILVSLVSTGTSHYNMSSKHGPFSVAAVSRAPAHARWVYAGQKFQKSVCAVATFVPSLHFDASSATFVGQLEFPLNGTAVSALSTVPVPRNGPALKAGAALPSACGSKVFSFTNNLEVCQTEMEMFGRWGGGGAYAVAHWSELSAAMWFRFTLCTTARSR
jgi:hypothetical protein